MSPSFSTCPSFPTPRSIVGGPISPFEIDRPGQNVPHRRGEFIRRQARRPLRVSRVLWRRFWRFRGSVSNSERGYHVFSDVGTKLECVGFNEAVHVRVATDIFSRIGLTRCLSDPYIPSADVATSSLEIRVAIRQFG